ncbi:MAG: hypothetical protein HY565_05945 [Candidatus Kerfeldbacteria bacterium]|nr:hypothetical protein [Candidatus Kerfeldbacteria bacterium]
MHRRRFLATFIIGGSALIAGCAPDTNLDSACYTPDGCSPLTAAAGLNQYDLLKLAYNNAPPTDRRFAFEVLRGDGFVEPDRDEFEIVPAPEGAATERSYDPDQTELYTFKDGETVIFYEVFDT